MARSHKKMIVQLGAASQDGSGASSVRRPSCSELLRRAATGHLRLSIQIMIVMLNVTYKGCDQTSLLEQKQALKKTFKSAFAYCLGGL